MIFWTAGEFFRPRHSTECTFIRGEGGQEFFHPLNGLGPSYGVADAELRIRLYNTRFGQHIACWLGLAFLLFWLGYYQGPDRGMSFAPPLLLIVVGIFMFRMRLRMLLRGVSPAPNLWREARPGSNYDWREVLGFAVLVPACILLGRLARGLF